MRLTFNGDFCDIGEPMVLCPRKLARNVVANVLCSHTLWLSVAQSCGKVLLLARAFQKTQKPSALTPLFWLVGSNFNAKI